MTNPDREMSSRLRGLAAELFIVVFGILLALGADAWWQHRLDLREEQRILEALELEMIANLELLRSGAERHEQQSAAIQAIAGLGGRGPVEIGADSAAALVREATRWMVLNPEVGVLSALQSSGDLALIRDRGLQTSLGAWRSSLDDLAEGERLVIDARNQTLRHLAQTGTPVLFMFLREDNPFGWDPRAVFEDEEAMELLAMQYRSLLEPATDDYPRVVAEAEDIIQQVRAHRR